MEIPRQNELAHARNLMLAENGIKLEKIWKQKKQIHNDTKKKNFTKIITTETPRLTRFRLARNSLQHGFGLGTKKFT